jgi:hypothetical protein
MSTCRVAEVLGVALAFTRPRQRAGDFGLQRWYESLARPWTDLATFDRSLAVR